MKKKIFLLISSVLVTLVSLSACQVKVGSNSSNALNQVHFDFDSASISPEMAEVLDANAGYLKKHRAVKVVVEGHCDERGTNEYNLALGDRRANAAQKYLSLKGVVSDRVRTMSYGEERPVDAGHNESSWYVNRRAEFVRQ